MDGAFGIALCGVVREFVVEDMREIDGERAAQTPLRGGREA